MTRLEVPKKKEGKQEGKDLKDSTEEPVNFEGNLKISGIVLIN